MSTKTTILVTGGNRGLGKGLVEHYLSLPNYVVIAGVRDPAHTTSKALPDLVKGANSSLIIIKIESTSSTDAASAVEELQSTHNITALDIVIANAGIAKVFPPVSEVKILDIREHFEVNVYAAKAPKFITLGTSAASLTDMEKRNFPNPAYGTSKAALNYVTRKIHFENLGLTAFPLDPGWVQTDMGNGGAQALGMEKAEIPVAESVGGMVKVIDGASREKTSGKFMLYDGSEQAW